ncbi:Di-copper centre-containing protein [Amniculicola lignicola CBS 123094]|uniref:tyrosinase n=1 Tax=Amniculicola lignicola CBS 123094 TaxID=1392246 RepID=A0A6A5X2N3_9PLEO|nr:Di-copper centre-containing protein [Amniculicola lignicola CBS 123094]
MKLILLGALSLLSTLSSCSPLSVFRERQAPGSYYSITGAKGGVHPRLEIRELQKTGEMWNLFLLALTEFEAMDQSEIDSYYQIAGIHGMPWYDWDGVATTAPNGKRPERGYCTHAQLLFSVWHRPYLALFEQKLQSIAISIAGRFSSPEKEKYQDAAQKLRLPYWDWAKAIPQSELVFPEALSVEKVEVTQPDKLKVQIDNPLFDYDFHPHNQAEINKTGCAGFGALEATHDVIHVEMAPAHMVPPAVSAFDPVFWLHHANVDRMVAIWQALYPDDYVNSCNAETATWTIQPGDPLNANTPLTPFHRDTQGSFWTAALARNTNDLGYTYPEIQNKPSNETLIAKIKELYAGSEFGGDVPTKRHIKRQDQGESTITQQYGLKVTLPKSGYPYSVFIFLGSVGGGAETWVEDKSFVTLTSTLGIASEKANQASLDITKAVEQSIESGETTEEKAVEYLLKSLKWKIGFANAEIPRSDMSEVKVELLTSKVEKATEEGQFDRQVGGYEPRGVVDG